MILAAFGLLQGRSVELPRVEDVEAATAEGDAGEAATRRSHRGEPAEAQPPPSWPARIPPRYHGASFTQAVPGS